MVDLGLLLGLISGARPPVDQTSNMMAALPGLLGQGQPSAPIMPPAPVGPPAKKMPKKVQTPQRQLQPMGTDFMSAMGMY